MAARKKTDEEILEVLRDTPSATEAARILGLTERALYYRRRSIEDKILDMIPMDGRNLGSQHMVKGSEQRKSIELKDGLIIVGSDAHYWPDIESTAQRALVYLMSELKPEIFVMNGDSFDGPAASRFGRINWEQQPTVAEELRAVQYHLGSITEVSPDTIFIHTLGNHDDRFDTFLSKHAGQFEGVPGFSLPDHLPDWEFCRSLRVNGTNTVIKHRYHGGVHAAYNNAVKSGTNMITGHNHASIVIPFTDYKGTRYAVDAGTLADPCGVQFKYAEDNPVNHRSGFVVLTYQNGELMPPELVQVVNEEKGEVFFRGRKFKV